MGYWNITHFRPEFGILAHRNRDIGIPVTDFGYWDIAQKESGTVNRYLLQVGSKLGYWDMGPLKLGYWDMGLLKLGYLGYCDPLLDTPIYDKKL